MKPESRFERVKKVTSKAHPCLSVGTLTADVMDQRAAVQTLEDQNIELLHIDIMDGQVWPKITVGHFFVAGLKTNLLKDVHLLVANPDQQIPLFIKSGADMISFAVESCDDIGKTIEIFKNAAGDAGRSDDVRCGLSLYAGTSLETIRPHLDEIDYVTLVSIGPDTGKDNFLHETESRVAQLRAWKEGLLICIDGAVKKSNIGEVALMGGNVIVTGSAVFDGNDAAQNIIAMKQQIKEAFASQDK